MVSLSAPVIEPTTILRHQSSILPAMAMLAGMQLDLFTPLKDGPLTGKEIAAAIGVNAPKLMPLLYALVVAELLTLDNDRFSNTQEAATYLVAGHPSYLHGRNEFLGDIWQALLKTAATIRAGAPQHKHDFYAMSEEEMGAFFRGQHLGAVTAGESGRHPRLLAVRAIAGCRRWVGHGHRRLPSLPYVNGHNSRPPEDCSCSA